MKAKSWRGSGYLDEGLGCGKGLEREEGFEEGREEVWVGGSDLYGLVVK